MKQIALTIIALLAASAAWAQDDVLFCADKKGAGADAKRCMVIVRMIKSQFLPKKPSNIVIGRMVALPVDGMWMNTIAVALLVRSLTV